MLNSWTLYELCMHTFAVSVYIRFEMSNVTKMYEICFNGYTYVAKQHKASGVSGG